jgi:glutathione S-transferase
MTDTSIPELISFELCPFVQRSVITLLQKGIDFNMTYIDLKDPPEWFQQISPLGKVPVMRMDNAVLFESAVINEYLDEVYPPSFHPNTALKKAQNRAWIEFGSELLINQYLLVVAQDEETLEQHQNDLLKKFHLLENELKEEGPFFNGADFSLVDAAYAPVFMRFEILAQHFPFDGYQDTPKIKTWAQSLLALNSVKKSVAPDFETLFVDFFKNQGSHLLK